MTLLNGPILFGGSFVTGVEDDPETGCLRMYVGPRYLGVYALVENEAAKDELRRGWAQSFSGHLMVQTPPADCLLTDEEAGGTTDAGHSPRPPEIADWPFSTASVKRIAREALRVDPAPPQQGQGDA